MAIVTPTELDAFVAFVDAEGGGDLRHPLVRQRYEPFEFRFSTPRADASVSPFDDRYFESQLSLYREISGRDLDQWSGELHPVDIDRLVDAANPQGIGDVSHMSENVRALSAMVSMLQLGEQAPMLDLGAGHGVSSEVYAFCGARVHAVDIDPQLSELSRRRAQTRSLAVTRSVLNYDSLAALEDSAYAAAVFFQSLHHALRPWWLVEELKRKLRPGGVIAFCGEPIQDDPWPHWGLRLDIESVYVARKFGWFESGWSRTFITECFARSGMLLTFFGGGHQGGLIGVAACDAQRLQQVVTRASALGHPVAQQDTEDTRLAQFHSQIGSLASSAGRLGGVIRAHAVHDGGFLCFGPYQPLAAGRWRVSFLLTLLDGGGEPASHLDFDVVSDDGRITHHRQSLYRTLDDPTAWVGIDFVLASDAVRIETRACVPQSNVVWEMSLPSITRRDISG